MRLHELSIIAFFMLTPLACVAGVSAPSGSPLMGNWKTPDGAIVRVEPCRDAVCLRVVQVSSGAPSTTDGKNPDASLRARKLCGLTIGTGFHEEDQDHLAGGHLYDPKSGHTYHGIATVSGDTLKLRGYIGISLFGRTETWHRTGAPGPCR